MLKSRLVQTTIGLIVATVVIWFIGSVVWCCSFTNHVCYPPKIYAMSEERYQEISKIVENKMNSYEIRFNKENTLIHAVRFQTDTK